MFSWKILTIGATVFSMLMVSAGRAEDASLRIITSAQPHRVEQFAAEEIAIYLKKMTGADVSIENTDAAPDGRAIVVGRHPSNGNLLSQLEKKHPTSIVRNRDAFAIDCDESILRLAGNSPTATFWAATEWLQQLGVRWFFPGAMGEYVPAIERIALKKQTLFDAPRLDLRGPNYGVSLPSPLPREHGLDINSLFSIRHRMNYTNELNFPDGWFSLGSGHSYEHFAGAYLNEHPEALNLVDGKRGGGYRQLCFTDAGVADAFANSAMAEIAESLKLGFLEDRMRLSVSPNDGPAICECENCQKLVDSDGSTSSLTAHFANEVARRVHAQYPKIKVYFYAYMNHAIPAERVKLDANVNPELTFWVANTAVSANHAHPMMSSPANDKFRRYFAGWSSMSDGISAYTYYGHYNWFTPFPLLTQIAYDLPAMAADPKFYGMYSESHLHWSTQGPNFYLHMKLSWNPNLNSDDLVDDYFARAFGPAHHEIEQYFAILQKQMDGIDIVSGLTTEIPKLLTSEVIAACNQQIDRAETKLDEMDEATRWRTNLVIQGWRYSAKFADAIHRYAHPTSPDDGEVIARITQEINDFAQTELGRYAFEREMQSAVVEPILNRFKVPLTNLPPGEHNYADYFEHGGGLKFFATIHGFEPGQWGYLLPQGASGFLDVPVRAADGHKITAAEFQWTFTTDPGKADVQIEAIGDDGTSVTILESQPEKKYVSIPESVLGRQGFRLRLLANSPGGEASECGVDSLTLRLKVE